MNPEVKQQWLKALRSGDYPQGTGSLCDPEGEGTGQPTFCCLGVLCDIHPAVEWDDDGDEAIYGNARDGAILNHQFARELGLPSSDVQIDNQQKLLLAVLDPGKAETDIDWNDTTLVELNDRGYNFNDIAAVIERLF